jgi:hypothetical protein
MTETFEDDCPDGGGGRPTKAQVEKVRDHLQRRRPHVHVTLNMLRDEMTARNFVIPRASLARLIPGKRKPPSTTDRVENRVTSRRFKNKREPAPPPKLAEIVPEVVAEIAKNIETAIVPIDPRLSLEDLTRKDQTSTMLAILENRERMALNIIIMRTMAQYPERMIVDMRSTAALVDALTIAAKLSGGAAIDITVGDHPPLNGAGNGEMKDVTPTTSSLTADFAKWRSMRKTNGA